MNELPPGLDDLGRRLEDAAEREIAARRGARRVRPRLRRLALPVGAALVAAAVSAGAVRVADRAGDPIQAEPGGHDAALAPAKDPAVVVASATANPGGGPPWVVRAYTSASGRECVQVGRLRDGVLGQVQNGRFRALPASAPGTCAAANARRPIVAVERRPQLDLTLVFGLAADGSSLTVRAGDRVRRVRPTGLGAFVTVFAGADRKEHIAVRSTAGGRVVVRRFN